MVKKDLTKLAGNGFGKSIYENQVKDKVTLDEKIKFVFPERIDRMASSFIQGFFSEIVSIIGLSGIEELVEIDSSIPNCKQFVIDNLE
jgi:hypothetical protein